MALSFFAVMTLYPVAHSRMGRDAVRLYKQA